MKTTTEEVKQRLDELYEAGVLANELGEDFLTDHALETLLLAKTLIVELAAKVTE